MLTQRFRKIFVALRHHSNIADQTGKSKGRYV